MIDSSKKQQQGFPEILTAEDVEPFKEKECLEGSSQKSLKEGQSVSGLEQDGHAPAPVTLPVCFPSICVPLSSLLLLQRTLIAASREARLTRCECFAIIAN